MDPALLLDLEKTLNETESRIKVLSANNDKFFLLLNGILIYLMQCGFAFLECGAVRAKNATNILFKNILDSFIGAIAYWCFGYAFAYGEGSPIIGQTDFVYKGENEMMAVWFFQFVFAATASTIVSGALAERCDFQAYLIYSVVTTGFIYPVVTHWVWSEEGWLSTGIQFDNNNVTESVGFQDFAGSAVVHLLGGLVALVGAAILGKRIVHKDEDGKEREIRGHSVPLAALGGFILFLGFFAFNGGSQLSISAKGDGVAVSVSVVNTIMAGAFGGISAMIVHRIMNHFSKEPLHWSLLVTINGGLAGMVAICASANSVYPYAAAIIGTVAGLNFFLWRHIITKVGVDDPVDAVAVHAGSGMWGVLAAPILTQDTGVVYAWDKRSFVSLGWNFIGVFAIAGWSIVVSLVLFGLLRLFRIFRVSPEVERKGLDIPKHGEPAYPRGSYGDGWADPIPSEADTYSLHEDLHPDEQHHRKSLPFIIVGLPRRSKKGRTSA